MQIHKQSSLTEQTNLIKQMHNTLTKILIIDTRRVEKVS